MSGLHYMNCARARETLRAAGFTVHVADSENGDQGQRIYYTRVGAQRNEHGWPARADLAQMDEWNNGRWTVRLPGDMI